MPGTSFVKLIVDFTGSSFENAIVNAWCSKMRGVRPDKEIQNTVSRVTLNTGIPTLSKNCTCIFGSSFFFSLSIIACHKYKWTLEVTKPFPNYAPITINNNTRSSPRAKLSEFCTKSRYGVIAQDHWSVIQKWSI